jgi:hypothetical protein
MYLITTNDDDEDDIILGKRIYISRHCLILKYLILKLNKLVDITKCKADTYQILSLLRFSKAKYIRGVVEKAQKAEQIFGDRYYLYDPKTIKRFNLEVNSVYIAGACANGAVEFLEWWFKSNLPLKYDTWALNNASYNGHVNVLEWWKNSGLPLQYTERALNEASIKGHINVLEWWFKSNLPLKYSEHALNHASKKGLTQVLEWWFKSGLPLKYNT